MEENNKINNKIDYSKLVKDGADLLELKLENITLNMRKPKVRDLYSIKSNMSDYETLVLLISSLSDVPKEYILDLDLKDFDIAREALEAFLDN